MNKCAPKSVKDDYGRRAGLGGSWWLGTRPKRAVADGPEAVLTPPSVSLYRFAARAGRSEHWLCLVLQGQILAKNTRRNIKAFNKFARHCEDSQALQSATDVKLWTFGRRYRPMPSHRVTNRVARAVTLRHTLFERAYVTRLQGYNSHARTLQAAPADKPRLLQPCPSTFQSTPSGISEILTFGGQ